MKTGKRIACFLLCLMMCLGLVPMTARAADEVAIDETNFPDQTFRTYVGDRFDTDNSGGLSGAEIDKVTAIVVCEEPIADLKGIEFFSALKSLNCDETRVKSIDVSKNPALEELRCNATKLTSLDVRNNPALTFLACEYCKLTSLKTKNPLLTYIDCNNNQLTKLDVSGDPRLGTLICYDNELSSLVIGNPELAYCYCKNNQLTTLDVSGCKLLRELGCENNQLSSLNVGSCPELRDLRCGGNKLSSLDLQNNPKLYRLDCENNRLTKLNLKRNTQVEVLYCYNNSISDLDISRTDCLSDTFYYGTKTTGKTWVKYEYLNPDDCDEGEDEWVEDGVKAESPRSEKGLAANYYDVWVFKADKTTAIHANGKPTILTQPGGRTVSIGAKATFKVEASGKGKKYQWYYRTSSSGSWKKVDSDSGRTETLSFTAKAKHNGYQYRCKVTNAEGSVYSKTVTLKVLNFTITAQPSAKTVTKGSKVAFKVKVSGSGLTYQWYCRKPGSAEWEKISKATKASYSFTAKAKHNGYKYRCQVKNKAGSVYTKAVKLTVK